MNMVGFAQDIVKAQYKEAFRIEVRIESNGRARIIGIEAKDMLL